MIRSIFGFCSLIYATVFLFSSYHVAGIRLFMTDPPISTTSFPLLNYTLADELKQKLFAKYEKSVRPILRTNATQVSFGIKVHTLSVDDTTGTIEVNLYTRTEWEDSRLKWNSSHYGGLDVLPLGSYEIWSPDIQLTNSAAHGTEYYGDRYLWLKSDGKITHVVPAIYRAYCHLDFTFWPFERNSCSLHFMSWVYNGNELNLKKFDLDDEVQEYESTNEWILEDVKTKSNTFFYISEPYKSLTFTFRFSRAAGIYYYAVFVPIIPIVFFTLLTFWLRPNNQMRFKINALVIIMVLVFLIFFGIKVPARPDSTPLIVKFYTGCLYLAILSLVVSTILMNINYLAYYFILPRSVTSFFIGKTGRYLGLKHVIHEIESRKSLITPRVEEDTVIISMSTISLNEEQSSPHSRSLTDDSNWILFAAGVDRVFFIVFCFIFICMGIDYIHVK